MLRELLNEVHIFIGGFREVYKILFKCMHLLIYLIYIIKYIILEYIIIKNHLSKCIKLILCYLNMATKSSKTFKYGGPV